ncbi:MAG: hypothetical protein U1E84_11705 [Rhodoferax sp.]
MNQENLDQESAIGSSFGKGKVSWELVSAAHARITQGACATPKDVEVDGALTGDAAVNGLLANGENFAPSMGDACGYPPCGQDAPSDAKKEGGEGGVSDTSSTAITTFPPFPTTVVEATVTANDVPTESTSTGEAPTREQPDALQFDDDVLTHRASENPVVTEAKAKGIYKTPLGSGMHEIKCPWGQEHVHSSESSATYTEPDEYQPLGAFRCKEACHAHLTAKDLLEELGVPKMVARNKPTIRNIPGNLHEVVDAAERVLAGRGKYYQSGTVIVSVTTDPASGNPAVSPTSMLTLTRELSAAASWEKEDSRSGGWKPCDPPARHVSVLYNASDYRYLPPLAGVARQPYISEVDESLIVVPGYNDQTLIFGVFDPAQFPVSEPTKEEALQSLDTVMSLLKEFHFSSDHDRAAMVSAILTATLRPSLAHAPAFHVRAHDIGSGKSYACELISAFASPAPSEKVSYPTTSEEATKAILSLLLKNPAVIEFDDMDSDWIAHGAFKRMLTAEYVTDRVLGYSKTATVRTRVLFLGSGNNVGPRDDMRRRVATINLDPKCATPTTMDYKGSPVEEVRKNRGLYVAAALTIVQAWIKAGKPRAAVKSIASYGTWSDYCRQSLLWLGLPDPATSLLDQVTRDPEGDPLGELLHAWKGSFDAAATTVRKAIRIAGSGQKRLDEAIRDCLGEDQGPINPTKLGWYLKKHAGRIVHGMRFVESTADGRKAWKLVVIDPEALHTASTARTTSADDSDLY